MDTQYSYIVAPNNADKGRGDYLSDIFFRQFGLYSGEILSLLAERDSEELDRLMKQLIVLH